MRSELRLNPWNSNAEQGAVMALKTHKTLAFSKGLEAHVRARLSQTVPVLWNLFAQIKGAKGTYWAL